MSFDLNITVNGSRCKQYSHQGKIFIEAKQSSEYVIEIKNNHWKRVLMVGSVDGLNVLTGKTASENDTGYIIGAYSAEKIKGFRVSDDEWALFKFGYKFNGNTYAQSKEDGSEKNCGVIGVRLFYEKDPVVTYSTWNSSFAVSCSYAGNLQTNYMSNVNYQPNNLISQNMDMTMYASNCTKGGGLIGGQSATLGYSGKERRFTSNCSTISTPASDECLDFSQLEYSKRPEFNMGTEFGRKEHSKVRNVEFIRGYMAQSFDIYYASREALIAMGVPITNELQINLPQSFTNSYCTPPKNWVG